MPSITRKICSKHGIYTTKRCNECKQESNKSYDDTARDKDSYQIYHSARWKRVRQHILKRDGGVCCKCGAVNKVMIIDHIKEIKDAPELTWDYDNLECLCIPCHNSKTVIARKQREGGF